MSASDVTSPWVHRLLLWGALAALPLFLFGGTITTVGAGMAVQGWWDAEGHFMPLFPLDKWFRDFGTFVEHTHRQFGMVVGLCVLGATLVALGRGDRRARLASSTALIAVVAQGSLGGLRVLENSPQLAFLHGVAGQGVFAVLLGATLVASARYGEAGRTVAAASASARGPARAGLAAWGLSLAVFGQVALGAWYRHALRTGNARVARADGGGALVDGIDPRLLLHLGIAFAVLGLVVAVARSLKRAAAEDPGSAPLAGAARRLHLLVGVQILLGFGAWLTYAPAPLGGTKEHPPLEITLAALHVLGGALLLAQSVQAALWCGRLSAAGARRAALDPAEAAA